MEAPRRIDKVEYIMSHKFAALAGKNLFVCNSCQHEGFTGLMNCTICDKCVGTLFEMYASGVLNDNSTQSFNRKLFDNNLQNLWSELIAENRHHAHPIKDISEQADKHNISLPEPCVLPPEPKIYQDASALDNICPDWRADRNRLVNSLLAAKRFADIDEICSYEKKFDPGWTMFAFAKKEEAQGRIDKAIAQAKMALEHEPYATKTREYLISLFLKNNQESEAQKLVAEGLAADRFWGRGYLHLAELRPEAKLESLKKAANIMPHSLALRGALANYYIEGGQIAEAIAELENALEYVPDWKEGAFGLALLYEQNADFERAIKALAGIAEIDAQARLALFRLLCLHRPKGEALAYGTKKLGYAQSTAVRERSRIITEAHEAKAKA